MGCIYVETCPEGTPCYSRQIDCECGGCPGSAKDPNSLECKCKDTACAAPRTTKLDGSGNCECTCPDPVPECPSPNKPLNNNTCTCECIVSASCAGDATPTDDCACECADPLKTLCQRKADNTYLCVGTCPDDGNNLQAVNPDTCECEGCPEPKRHVGAFCCPELPEGHVPARTDADPCHTCPKCPDDKELDPETCDCESCPVDVEGIPGTHEFCDGKCLPKCTDGKIRHATDTPPNCDCVCPDDKIVDPNDATKCVDCPVDEDGVPGTHELCDGKCLPKCPSGQVRVGDDCQCYCPPGKKQIQLQDGSFDCVNRTYNCTEEGCVEAADDTGGYDTLTECNQACGDGPACFPIPDPPIGVPIFCPDGATQIGIILYPLFDFVSCTWPGVPVYFGNTCDGGGGGSSGTSDGGGNDCCNLANPGPTTFTRACGATVPKKTTGYAAPCAGHYTEYTWCETCFNGVVPLLRRTDTYIFNPDSCEFELFMATPDVGVCPAVTSSSTGGGGGSSTGATSSSTSAQPSSAAPSSSANVDSSSSTLSSGSPQSSASSGSSALSAQSSATSGQNSSGSSGSSCAPEPVSIGFAVSSTGTPLNNFGPGSTALVTVLVSNVAAAARSGVHWDLTANGAIVAGFDVSAGDPNPRTFTISAESLLATLGLTFATAPLSSYTFNFCGTATNCANISATSCNGRITVKIPGRSSSSQRSAASSATQSSSTAVSATSSSSAVAGSSSSARQSSSSRAVIASSSSTSCASLGVPPCGCYLIVTPPGGCPAYQCLPNETCCEAIFGQRFDGGNAATDCTNNVVDLGDANPALGCLNCQAGNCGCEETIDGGDAFGNQPNNRDCGTAAGCSQV